MKDIIKGLENFIVGLGLIGLVGLPPLGLTAAVNERNIPGAITTGAMSLITSTALAYEFLRRRKCKREEEGFMNFGAECLGQNYQRYLPKVARNEVRKEEGLPHGEIWKPDRELLDRYLKNHPEKDLGEDLDYLKAKYRAFIYANDRGTVIEMPISLEYK